MAETLPTATSETKATKGLTPGETWKAEFLGSDHCDPIDPDGFKGTMVIVGGGSVPQGAREIVANRVEPDGAVVVITAASAERTASGESAKTMLQDAGVSRVIVAPELPDPNVEGEQLAAILAEASGAWICGGQQTRLSERYASSQVEMQLIELLKRGGVVAGTSAGAAIMSKVMIASGREQPEFKQGFDLLSGSIVDQHFSQRERITRCRSAVATNPGKVGVGIDESTALIVRGRTMRVVGSGAVTFLLAPCDYRPAEELRVESGQPVDWVQLRRAARERAFNRNPGTPRFGTPQVAAGSLVIVGGGGMPNDVVQKFIALAGGKDAHIVVLPTAVSRNDARQAELPEFLTRANVASVTVLPQMGTAEVSSPTFKAALQRATGIWFGGGRQWNFVDAYDCSDAVELFHQVLQRGGVIGGSSAGATIQGEFLVRGHPLGNTTMMAEGYERGFAFLPGVAIDQHFSQRARQPDLMPVVERHPDLVGIGIDEATALVVQGTKAEVLGRHAVHFITAEQVAKKEYLTVKAGDSIDLNKLRKPPE